MRPYALSIILCLIAASRRYPCLCTIPNESLICLTPLFSHNSHVLVYYLPLIRESLHSADSSTAFYRLHKNKIQVFMHKLFNMRLMLHSSSIELACRVDYCRAAVMQPGLLYNALSAKFTASLHIQLKQGWAKFATDYITSHAQNSRFFGDGSSISTSWSLHAEVAEL